MDLISKPVQHDVCNSIVYGQGRRWVGGGDKLYHGFSFYCKGIHCSRALIAFTASSGNFVAEINAKMWADIQVVRSTLLEHSRPPDECLPE